MGCDYPQTVWHSKEINKSGKRSLVWSRNNAEEPDMPFKIACGQCVGCRITKTGEWGTRMMHEASRNEDNCFITLTFNDESLYNRKEPWNLDKTDWQRFVKRLRDYINKSEKSKKIKYFACGEYGDNGDRPHYHAIIFNHDFTDKKLYSERGDIKLYKSKELEELWPYGMCTIGEVTKESTSYVARYTMKKINGDRAEEHYQRINEDGLVTQVIPEFALMSTRPAIGREFYQEYNKDMYPKDFITSKGVRQKIPKYYDRLETERNDIGMDDIKEMRETKALKYTNEQTPERLEVKRKIRKIKIDKLVRKHDK